MVNRYTDRPNLTISTGKFAVLQAFSFAEFSRYHLIQNIRKMITNQKNVMMKQLRIFKIQAIYIPRILNYYRMKKWNATKRHMFYSIMSLIKKPNLRSISTTCFLCITHLEIKNNYSVAILPHMQVNFQNPG